ncbi:LCP family protein [Nocardiopsis potens]|uniref:LCP family protein n=1 Tax=Nocardiopsis potens TaxID=1246458 RepID=UPI00034589AC|nr:LCP family protein [Nocardiopsis potens]
MAHGPNDAERTGVFRRGDDGGYDEIEKLYRPPTRRTPSGSGGGGEGRRKNGSGERSAERSTAAGGRGGRSGGHGPGRVYDGSGRRRREQERRRRIWRNGAVAALVVVLLVVVVFPVGMYIWADGRLDRVEALPDYEGRPEDQPGTTFLIVGSDSREGLSDDDMQDLRTGRAEGKRTDTIMVLYVPEDGKPTILSVPRDSYVPIPGIGENKINAAFAEDLGGGPSTLVQTFEQASGVRIDHYVEIGFAGFVDIVDAVGGVEMCPEEPMEDPKAGLDIEAGCQEMDGSTALGYVRTRASARADLDRIQRQREFFSALIGKATDTSTLINPFRSVPLVSEGTETFDVDQDDHLMDLAQMALAMRDKPTTSSIPVGSTPTLAVGSVVLWDEEASGRMFSAMQNGEQIPEDVLRD